MLKSASDAALARIPAPPVLSLKLTASALSTPPLALIAALAPVHAPLKRFPPRDGSVCRKYRCL
jgi:hypothetical protein